MMYRFPKPPAGFWQYHCPKWLWFVRCPHHGKHCDIRVSGRRGCCCRDVHWKPWRYWLAMRRHA